MRICVILETEADEGKEKIQAKIGLKRNEKLSSLLLTLMGEGIWKLECQETRDVSNMEAINKIFEGTYG
jgi:hypothetical protein